MSQVTVVGLTLRGLLRVKEPDGSTSPRAFHIREYQRDYAWTAEDQVETLYGDLRDHFRDSEGHADRYVMGPMIVCPSQPLESTTDPMQLQRTLQFEVVDGQQRLTTLILLLAAIRRHIQKENSSESLAALLSSVLDGVEIHHHDNDVARTLEDLLGNNVRQIADSGAVARRSRSAENLATNFEVLERKVAELYRDDNFLYSRLAQGLLESIVFAVTIAHDRALALLSFERANARGLDLDSTDLIKNLVFMREEGSTTAFQSWSQLDKKWKETRDRCENGTPKLHFADVIRWHHEARDVNAEKLTGAKIYRHISRAADPPTGSQYVQSLSNTAHWLTSIHRSGLFPGATTHEFDGLLGLIRVRGRTQMKQHLPVLLAAREWSHEDFAELARALEALMLVNTVCSIRGQVIEAILRTALTQIRGDVSGTDEAVVTNAKIIQQIHEQVGKLVEEHGFAQALLTHRYDSNGESQTIRYVLERVEAAVRATAKGLPAHAVSELRATWAKIGGSAPGSVREDLDHVWPQSLRADFPTIQGDDAPDQHHRIGNLILWFASGHRPSGDTPASQKIAEYYGQDSENIVRYLLSPASASQNSYSWARSLGLRVTTNWTADSVKMLGMFYVLAISEVLSLPLEPHVIDYKESLS